jgi:hypothetical protein
MARQTPREDLFTPIHKTIRSMIYDLGTKLQKTDFIDVAATNAILPQLKHNLQSANSTCIICMLHEHGGHEDQSIFPQLTPFDSKAVDAMIQEHVEITRQMVEISKVADELSQLNDKSQRIEMGNKLNSMVNNLLVSYLVHLNNEEANIILVQLSKGADNIIKKKKKYTYQTRDTSLIIRRWGLVTLTRQVLVSQFDSVVVVLFQYEYHLVLSLYLSSKDGLHRGNHMFLHFQTLH